MALLYIPRLGHPRRALDLCSKETHDVWPCLDSLDRGSHPLAPRSLPKSAASMSLATPFLLFLQVLHVFHTRTRQAWILTDVRNREPQRPLQRVAREAACWLPSQARRRRCRRGIEGLDGPTYKSPRVGSSLSGPTPSMCPRCPQAEQPL